MLGSGAMTASESRRTAATIWRIESPTLIAGLARAENLGGAPGHEGD